jgi:hypothetical protein
MNRPSVLLGQGQRLATLLRFQQTEARLFQRFAGQHPDIRLILHRSDSRAMLRPRFRHKRRNHWPAPMEGDERLRPSSTKL